MHPARELKTLQRWINVKVLKHLPVSSAASAYEQGCSILANAQVHRTNRFLLRVDLRNFFESIRRDDVLSLLKRHAKTSLRGLVEQQSDRDFVANIVCKEGRTVIGAPSSPFIANRVMYPLDVKIGNKAQSLSVIYTRYADDMFFSSSQTGALDNMFVFLKRLLDNSKSPDLAINEAKTVYSSKKTRRMITGLIIDDEDRVSLGRQVKRYLRVGLHKAAHGKFDEAQMKSLSGRVAHAYSIEPAYMKGLLDKYEPSQLIKVGLAAPPRYRKRKKDSQ